MRAKKVVVMNKKGQAAALVGIIMLIIVLYIIFLPPADRAELLGDESETAAAAGRGDTAIHLLEANPGILGRDITKKNADKGLPNIFLVESTNSEILERVNPFTITNSLLGSAPKQVLFSIDDLENTDDVLLTFSARKHKGVLQITLNGNRIFNFGISQFNVAPIKLPKGFLKRENTLLFEVSRGTLGANEYSLENVRIIGNVRDPSRQNSESSFTLLPSELATLEAVSLRFVPYCAHERNLGQLNIFINNQNIYRSVPVCDDPVRQSFPVNYLHAGSNSIVFESGAGSYSVEQIFLNLDFKEQRTPTYFFELNSTSFSRVQNGTSGMFLTMRFTDDEDTDNRFFVNINGHKRGEFDRNDFENDGITFRYDISRFAERRNNYIQIIPKNLLKIVTLDVTLEKD